MGNALVGLLAFGLPLAWFVCVVMCAAVLPVMGMLWLLGWLA